MADPIQIPNPPSDLSREERTWGMVCHLAALAGVIVPLGNFIAPLVIWLIKKEQMPFVNDQGKEALNFQITILIMLAVSFALIFVFIGFLLLFVVSIYALIMVIIAAIKANDGQYYRYPLTIRFIK